MIEVSPGHIIAHALEELADRVLASRALGTECMIESFIALEGDQMVVANVDLWLFGQRNPGFEWKSGVVAMNRVEVVAYDAERRALSGGADHMDLDAIASRIAAHEDAATLRAED